MGGDDGHEAIGEEMWGKVGKPEEPIVRKGDRGVILLEGVDGSHSRSRLSSRKQSTAKCQ